MRILRIACAALFFASGSLSMTCYMSYRLDQYRLRKLAFRETRGVERSTDRAIRLMSWVHSNRSFAKNQRYFLIRRLGPTPVHVLNEGGDCADKSRLLSSMLRELGIPSTLAMCFDNRGNPTHTVVNARLPDGSDMVLDPIWDLCFPKDTHGGFYGLLDLRRDPNILWHRLDVVTAAAAPTAKIHYYNRVNDIYDYASTINWEKNLPMKSIGAFGGEWMGDCIFCVPRPTPLEEPKLFVSLASLLPALVSLAIWVVSQRWCRVLRKERGGRQTPVTSNEGSFGDLHVLRENHANNRMDISTDNLKSKPALAELHELVRLKHDQGDPTCYGWATRMRLRFGYFTPDEIYEATVAQVVIPGCAWLDVGCGRDIFPNNRPLARLLADRCATIVGVDPDKTIEENPFVLERSRCTIDEFQSDRAFDVVTMRMVAEHITNPQSAAAALARLTRPGGKVVVYTINQWSPVSLISRVVPFRFHHPIKHLLWKTEAEDTFPVAYLMNTRRRLRRIFEGSGFREASFAHLDDCRTFANTRPLLFLELALRRGLNRVGLRYPENCLLAVYERLSN